MHSQPILETEPHDIIFAGRCSDIKNFNAFASFDELISGLIPQIRKHRCTEGGYRVDTISDVAEVEEYVEAFNAALTGFLPLFCQLKFSKPNALAFLSAVAGGMSFLLLTEEVQSQSRTERIYESLYKPKATYQEWHHLQFEELKGDNYPDTRLNARFPSVTPPDYMSDSKTYEKLRRIYPYLPEESGSFIRLHQTWNRKKTENGSGLTGAQTAKSVS